MSLNIFSPLTKIKSALVNANFSGLADGSLDDDRNSLEITRRAAITNFVHSGFTIATSANLTSTILAGVATVNGKYVAVGNTIKAFTASKDTYVDLKDDGTFAYVEVANGATSGMTLTTNSDGSNALRIAKVVTSGTAITTVTQYGRDPLERSIYNLAPISPTQLTGSTWAWKNWTPTFSGFTVGNATVIARYSRVGDLVFCYIQVTLGSTSAMGANFNGILLPVNANMNTHSSQNAHCGVGNLGDVGTANHVAMCRIESLNSVHIVRQSVSGANIINAGVTTTTPFTWTTGDMFQLSFFYEAAQS